MRYSYITFLLLVILISSCGQTDDDTARESGNDEFEFTDSDMALLDRVEEEKFNYFWEGGEPLSGAARERIHMDNIYPSNDKDVVTTGGTGFGIMATIAAIERGFITRKQGYERLRKLTDFLTKAERYHGAWPHWMLPDGSTQPFGRDDDGGDLVETAFIVQGLIAAREYFKTGNEEI